VLTWRSRHVFPPPPHPSARLALALVLATGLVAGHCPALAIAKGDAAASEAEPKANATADALLAADKTGITDMTTDELKRALSENPQTIVIDVRTLRGANLSGGIIRARRNDSIPSGWLELRIVDAVPEKTTAIVVYYYNNLRDPIAVQTLQQMGHTNVRNYAEGFPAWKKAGPADRTSRRRRTLLPLPPLRKGRRRRLVRDRRHLALHL
jgi:rhodanese-related sulfurtransferase